jgi:hypothetical protein
LQGSPHHVSSGLLFQELDNCLSIAFSLLLVSIAIVPTLVFSDGLVAQSIIAALAALAVAFVGISARAADVNFAGQATRYLKLAAAVPAIWMIVQILPMPFSAMSHSIWINANEALDQQGWGHISVDIGRTIQALAFYLANVSLIVVAVFVAKDRRRAELLLFALTAISLLATIALLIGKSGLITGLTPREADGTLSALSALGVILSLTTGVHSIERYESKRRETEPPRQTIRTALALCGAGLLICAVGMAASATLNTGLVVLFGVVAIGSLQAFRRVALAGWATGIFTATLITAAAMVVLWRYDSVHALSPFLQFATSAPPNAISVAQRMLSDTGWMGIGAGAYAPLLPIYQELGSSVTKAPSTAAALAIQLGWPMALFTIATAIGLVVILFRGSLVRGRDSFYPAAAAACAIVILGQAFCDNSLQHSCVAVLGDAVIGLGLAQSMSQGAGT